MILSLDTKLVIDNKMKDLLLKCIFPAVASIFIIFQGYIWSKKDSYSIRGFTYDRQTNPFFYWLWIIVYYILGICLVVSSLFNLIALGRLGQ